jgi:outer membrane protein OmpA-like peptidoglycan-associated protein
MKIVTYIVVALLIGALAGGAFFYLSVHKPMEAELARMKAGQPEFENARREMRKHQDREKQESAWISPVAETLKKGMAAEIEAGKAEVVVADGRIVVNIDENVLFTPQSVTFGQNSQPVLTNLAALIKDIKDKEINIGNTTRPVPAHGKGRKRVPAKDARSLAAARSHELVKSLIKNGVADRSLVASTFAETMPDGGFKIKGEKTMIIIGPSVAAAPAPAAAAPQPQTKPSGTAAAASGPTTTAPQPPQQKPIPISPSTPKKVQ